MTAGRRQPSSEEGGAITCEYRELHGANAYSATSVLVVRLAIEGADGLPWTLERPSAALDRCAELLEALGLSGAEVRARTRWPVGSLVQSIAEQLVGRLNLPAGAPAPTAAAAPERELVLTLDDAAAVRAGCELAAALVSASVSGPASPHGPDRLRGLLDEFDRDRPAPPPRTSEFVTACRQRDIPWAQCRRGRATSSSARARCRSGPTGSARRAGPPSS